MKFKKGHIPWNTGKKRLDLSLWNKTHIKRGERNPHWKGGLPHIDYEKGNCKENNLISLCSQCNSRANFNRNYWFGYFRTRITTESKITK